MAASVLVAAQQRQGKDSWEKAEVPILCESCLGENPFVRMTKEHCGRECKICARPFTVFRWKPGAKARYKKTEVCQTCAKMKNVCQTCLFDLEYQLPVAVRDKYLEEVAGPGSAVVIPDSVPNKNYALAQIAKQVEDGEMPYGKHQSHPMLERLARKDPYYKRNRPHICSFFVKGQCTRGEECPYRHEMPEGGELADQKFENRFHGKDDPVANKIFRIAEEKFTLHPPGDLSITSLYLGAVDANLITDTDIIQVFRPFGDIKSVRVIPKQHCAFVHFAERQSAEAAVDRHYGTLQINGIPLRLTWAKPPSSGRLNQPGKLL